MFKYKACVISFKKDTFVGFKKKHKVESKQNDQPSIKVLDIEKNLKCKSKENGVFD